MNYKYLLLSVIVFVCIYSCKKNVASPVAPVSIIGKWQLIKLYSQLYNNGVLIDTVKQSKFTSSDFVEYYSDGTGYYSKFTLTGPSLSEFTYTIKGTQITEFVSVENTGIPQTITELSATNLSVHMQSLVPDPNDPTVTDTEIDDFSYTR